MGGGDARGAGKTRLQMEGPDSQTGTLGGRWVQGGEATAWFGHQCSRGPLRLVVSDKVEEKSHQPRTLHGTRGEPVHSDMGHGSHRNPPREPEEGPVPRTPARRQSRPCPRRPGLCSRLRPPGPSAEAALRARRPWACFIGTFLPDSCSANLPPHTYISIRGK